MAYKIEDALRRYLNKDCTVFTVDEEFYGELTEVGDGFLIVSDAGTESIVNIQQITAVQVDFEG